MKSPNLSLSFHHSLYPRSAFSRLSSQQALRAPCRRCAVLLCVGWVVEMEQGPVGPSGSFVKVVSVICLRSLDATNEWKGATSFPAHTAYCTHPHSWRGISDSLLFSPVGPAAWIHICRKKPCLCFLLVIKLLLRETK